MSHWAEVDKDNVVIRVTVGNNEEPDEGYQWLVDNLGGTWLKTSYNTVNGVHNEGGTPFRWTFASPGFIYREDLDAFIEPSPFKGWIFDFSTMSWVAPIPKPDSGFWEWNNESENWVEFGTQ
jgi:hypothetical protein